MTVESSRSHLETGFVHWFLLTGDRIAVSFVILLGIGTAVFAVGILGIATVTTPSRVMWYLNGTVNGLLTLVPISVGVNQIVLSHEFGSVEDLHRRRSNITDFRERVEDRTDTAVTSPYASSFFGTLLSSVSDTARALQRESDDPRADSRTVTELETVADSIVEETDRTKATLAENGSTMTRTLLVMLSYEDTAQFHEIRRLQQEWPDGDGRTAEKLRRINELFIEIDAARQFLKTVVVERQLARLSRLLIYTGISSVTIAVIGIFTYRDIAGVTVPHVLLVGIAAAVIVTTLVPLAVLGSYILRVATIARRTAAYGPFIPESSE